jgi:hypothetical protein
VNAPDSIAAVSLGVAFAALCVSWYAIRRANRNTSAATLVVLNEGFREAWKRFFHANEGELEAELAELLNLFEIACAICLEGSLSGNSSKLMNEYLNMTLRMFVKHEYAREHIESLLQTERTFIYIKRFLRERRKSISVTIPPNWYELVEN